MWNVRARAKRGAGVSFAAALAALVAAVSPPRAAAQVVTSETEPTVTVTGTGQVQVEPDRAVLSLAVETFAATAREAAEENAAQMEELVGALRGLGLAEDRIRTTSYQLNPEYRQDREPRPREPTGEPRIAGYRAVNMVQVTMDDIGLPGRAIDTAIAAGANRVTGLSFGLRDRQPPRLEALRRAVQNARAEADAVAVAADRRLGEPVQIHIGGVYYPPPQPYVMERAMADMSASAPTPVEPGELTVSAQVTATFRIEPR
ncbi:MAG: SIMPL domain-containing protein [Longimicrobiales bacterium]